MCTFNVSVHLSVHRHICLYLIPWIGPCSSVCLTFCRLESQIYLSWPICISTCFTTQLPIPPPPSSTALLKPVLGFLFHWTFHLRFLFLYSFFLSHHGPNYMYSRRHQLVTCLYCSKKPTYLFSLGLPMLPQKVKIEKRNFFYKLL